MKNHMKDVSGAENIDSIAERTHVYSGNERKARAVKRIEDQGFDISTLFTPWDSTASLRELGTSSLSAVEEILKILLSSNFSHERIFILLDEAVNGARDNRTLEPCKPTYRPLEKLRQKLRDGPEGRLASLFLTKGKVGQAPPSEKLKRKPRKDLSQPPVKRTRQSLAPNLRDDTEELDVSHSQQSPESILPHSGDQLVDSDYEESSSQKFVTLSTYTRTSRPLRQRSSRQPWVETLGGNQVGADDSAGPQPFPSGRISNTQAVMGRGKQRHTQEDSAAGRTAESLGNDAPNHSNTKDWWTRLEPCIAAAQHEYDDAAEVYEVAKIAYITFMNREDDSYKSFGTAGTPPSRISIEAIESGTPESLIQKLNEIDAEEEKLDQFRIAYQKKKEGRIAQAKALVKSKSSMEKKAGLLMQLRNIIVDLETDGEDEAE